MIAVIAIILMSLVGLVVFLAVFSNRRPAQLRNCDCEACRSVWGPLPTHERPLADRIQAREDYGYEDALRQWEVFKEIEDMTRG